MVSRAATLSALGPACRGWLQRGVSSTACCHSNDGWQERMASSTLREEAQKGLQETPLAAGEPSGQEKEKVTRRKGAVVRAWLEERLGAEQVALVKILQTHGVVVRGGAEHGRKLVDALLDWKQQDALDMQKAWRQEYVEEERKD